jgi:predicted O-methyltransferase YrrM
MLETIEQTCRRTADWLARHRVERQVAMALAGHDPRQIPTHMSCRELHWLYQSARLLPRNSEVIEIGSYLGASSVYLAAGLSAHGGRLHCVDTWRNEGMKEGAADTFDQFQRNTAGQAGVINAIRMRSQDALPSLPGPFRLAFIDGDHSYEAVRDDLRLLADRMTPDGILALHDWRYFPGVSVAVLEFIRSTRWKPTGFVDNLIHLKQENT